MHAYLVLVVLLLVISTGEGVVAVECLPVPIECSMCNGTVAVCEMVDSLLPPGIPSSVENLTISYTGKPIAIRAQDFVKFSQLKHLKLSGSIESIEENTFESQARLTSLHIVQTMIKSLPASLFAANNTLRVLDLLNNKFRTLPLSLFHQLGRVMVLRISNKDLEVCPDREHGLGMEFAHLAQLKSLDLFRIRVPSTCDKLCDNLFRHLPNITTLNLVATNFQYDRTVLSKLQSLQVFDASTHDRFARCPNSAQDLFASLPETLTSFVARRWRIRGVDDPDCRLNTSHLADLKRLPNLKILNFEYSDLIFGPQVSVDLFHGFDHLEFLHIGWCRISYIADGAFDGCPKLTKLELGGNPLGPRRFRLYSEHNRTNSALRTLILRRTLLASDDMGFYDASQILFNAPNITELDFANNYFHTMPAFFVGIRVKLTFAKSISYGNQTSRIRRLVLDGNFLVHLYPSRVRPVHRLIHCDTLVHLKELSIQNNRLRDIEGLCPGLQRLHLRGNRLHEEWESINEDVIKSLASMEVLDLSQNGLTGLHQYTFYSMANLTELYLADNAISELPPAIFANNGELKTLDLKGNKLLTISWNVGTLTNLMHLHLSQNQLPTLQEPILENLKKHPSLRELLLMENNFICDCDDDQLQEFLSQTRIIPSPQRINCTASAERIQMAILNYKKDEWVCTYKAIVTYLCVTLGAIILSACILVPCYKYRWYVLHLRLVYRALVEQVRQIKYEHKCEYDAYVSYDRDSEVDGEWIASVLIPSMEESGDGSTEERLRLFVEHRDLEAGVSKHTERCKALERSRKILVVISNSYLRSTSCLGEADLAGLEMFGSEFYQPNRIMVLVREDLDEDFIKQPISSLLLQNVLMVKDSNARDMEKALKKTRQFLSKAELVYKKTRKSVRQQKMRRVELKEMRSQ